MKWPCFIEFPLLVNLGTILNDTRNTKYGMKFTNNGSSLCTLCTHFIERMRSTHDFYLVFCLLKLKSIFSSPGGRHTPQCPPALATPQTSQPRPPAPASITQRSGQPPPHHLGGQQVGWDINYTVTSGFTHCCQLSGYNTSDQHSIKRTYFANSSSIYPGMRKSSNVPVPCRYKTIFQLTRVWYCMSWVLLYLFLSYKTTKLSRLTLCV